MRFFLVKVESERFFPQRFRIVPGIEHIERLRFQVKKTGFRWRRIRKLMSDLRRFFVLMVLQL